MKSITCLAPGLLLLSLVWPLSHAGAQAPTDAHDTEARALYDAGAVAFSEGRFEEAYERFLRSYELSERPELLYNVAAAADRAGRDREALTNYQGYLVGVPDAENRAYVEARVAVLDARIRAEHVEPAPIEEVIEETSVLDERAPEPDPTVAITIFSLAGATGVAAIVTGILGLSIRGELETSCPMHACTDPLLASRAEQMASLGIATDVLAGTSLALAVGGILAALLMPSPPASARATLDVGPGTLRLSF